MARHLDTRARRWIGGWLVLLPLALAPSLGAQETTLAQENYLRPPKEIVDAVLAPRWQNVRLNNPSPDHSMFVSSESEGMPSIASFAKPHVYLGGLQVDMSANRARSFTTRGSSGFDIIAWQDGGTTEIRVPDGASVSTPTWSPDGAHLAYFAHFDDATHIYVADAKTGESKKLTKTPVLATLDEDIVWGANGEILTVLLPDARGALPPDSPVPDGPEVRMTVPGEEQQRTYPSLLETPHDKALLEYFTTGQLAAIDASNGSVTKIGEPAMIRSVKPSPDGQYYLVDVMTKPFTYLVPTRQFGGVTQVWDRSGKVLQTLSTEPLDQGTQLDSVAEATRDAKPRSFSWRPDGQGLSYLLLAPAAARQEEDQAGSERSSRKDRVMQVLPPFDPSTGKVVYENSGRLDEVQYSDDASILFLISRQGRGDETVYAVRTSDPSHRQRIKRSRSSDPQHDPGNLVMTRGSKGVEVVQLTSDGGHVLLEGTASADNPLREGPTSFVDRVDVATGEKERVYESENNGVFERVLTVLDPDATKLIVERESPTDVPDSYFRDVRSGELKQLTQNKDYTPDLTSAPRQVFEVARPDGFRFKVEVTLPPGYTAGTRIPALFWFYPREYTDSADYGNSLVRYNRNAFPNMGPRSMQFLIRLGYAVVEPDAPIIGESGRMNDHYVNDLRNDLAAVIDSLDNRGIIDRGRLAVGGHSYGAFSTANAMVHTPFFKAGIAGDGNYNRTLTPFSFQSERRTLWDNPDVYTSMSPIFYADQLTGALLMYTGMADQNVGTFPINSDRMFQALNTLGKTAALYKYPYEDHGPATQETLLDMWARWTEWLDRYVKNAGHPASPDRVATPDVSSSRN